MKTKLQLIPLDRLIATPPQYSRRGRVATIRLLLRSWAGRFEPWHWCLGFTLCQLLLGIILFVYSIGPYWISCALLGPGIMYPVLMLHPDSRRHPIANLVETNCASGFITLILTIIVIFT